MRIDTMKKNILIFACILIFALSFVNSWWIGPSNGADLNVTIVSPNNGTNISNLQQTFISHGEANSSLYILNSSIYIWNESAYNQYWNTTGLVAWYQFDDNTANDYFGVNNGTNSGAYQSTIGKIGGSSVFDGVNDYVNINLTGKLDAEINKISFSAWIKKNDLVGNEMIMDMRKSGSYSNRTLFLVAESSIRFAVTLDNNLTSYNIYSSISPSIWYNFVGVWNGTHLLIYKNGVSDATPVACSGTVKTAGVYNMDLGKQSFDAVSYFNGSIDDVRIYNRSLSATEIANLYAIEKNQFNNTYTGTNQSANFTYQVSGITEGKMFANVWLYESSNLYGAWIPNIFELTSDSCTAPTKNYDWIKNFNKNCVLSSNTDLGTGKLIITGTGNQTIEANLSAAGEKLTCSGTCKRIVNPMAKIAYT